MAGRISTRISLRWVPDEADEPTDTLVFNVGSYFIDLRVLKKDHSIDWGMAGVREILSEKPLKCRWNKIIDSLGAAGEADEGAFEPLPNGDSLETGSMPCPEKNDAMTDYEEVWRDVEIRPGSKRAWIIQSLDGKTFLGRIGGSYMAMSQGEGTSFSARREDLESVGGKWSTKYAVGEVEAVPSIASFETEGEEGWEIGKTVSLAGREYIVRASEEI